MKIACCAVARGATAMSLICARRAALAILPTPGVTSGAAGSSVAEPQKVYEGYMRAASKGRAFLLNTPADASGTIPEEHVAALARLKEIKE